MATFSATPTQFHSTPAKNRWARGASAGGWFWSPDLPIGDGVSDNSLESSASVLPGATGDNNTSHESHRSRCAGVRCDRYLVRAHEPAVVRRGVVRQPRAQFDHEGELRHIGAGPDSILPHQQSDRHSRTHLLDGAAVPAGGSGVVPRDRLRADAGALPLDSVGPGGAVGVVPDAEDSDG